MSIQEPDFGIYVRLSGFYIATVSTGIVSQNISYQLHPPEIIFGKLCAVENYAA
jgi:hypothetical protein